MKLPFASANLAYNNIVKIYESDPTFSPLPRLIYTGIVGTLRRVIDGQEYIEARLIGVASMLSWLYYTSGASYSFGKNQAQHLTMKDVIDVFSVKYPGILSYTGTSVEIPGGTGNVEFNYTKCLDALKKVVDTLQWYWTIDGSGVLQFHPLTGGATPTNHYFTIGRNIESLEVEEKSETIVNKYFIKYAGGLIYTASDATSETNNGLREFYEDKSSSVNDLTTATTQ